MTSEQIAELRRLEREATPAPWKWNDEEDQVRGPPMDGSDPNYSTIVETDSGYYPPHGADHDLIPAMRNALPRLLDEREALLRALTEVIYDNRPGGGAEDRARRVLDKVRAP